MSNNVRLTSKTAFGSQEKSTTSRVRSQGKNVNRKAYEAAERASSVIELVSPVLYHAKLKKQVILECHGRRRRGDRLAMEASFSFLTTLQWSFHKIFKQSSLRWRIGRSTNVVGLDRAMGIILISKTTWN
jgi:hypothetical protein